MKYNVTVNGKSYEVEVSAADSAAGLHTESRAPEVQPGLAPQQAAPQQAAPQQAAGGGEPVCSPMPGQIVSINVTVGQQIEKGQILLVLEAMKMENEILAARAGVVESIAVSRGSSVNASDILLTLK